MSIAIAVEIRDKATFIPAIVMKVDNTYPCRVSGLGNRVLLINMNTLKGEYDAGMWPSRTLREAHKWACKEFEKLYPGCVIDVEYILGETSISKSSQASGIEGAEEPKSKG
jgi:hypothetical protein